MSTQKRYDSNERHYLIRKRKVVLKRDEQEMEFRK